MQSKISHKPRNLNKPEAKASDLSVGDIHRKENQHFDPKADLVSSSEGSEEDLSKWLPLNYYSGEPTEIKRRTAEDEYQEVPGATQRLQEAKASGPHHEKFA